jgi:hypothetical protein
MRLAAQTDTTLVDSHGDTLLLRKTTFGWNVGMTGGAAVGINTGMLSLNAAINNNYPRAEPRADFAGQNFGDASAWMAGLAASWQPTTTEQDGVRYGGRIGFLQQRGALAYTPPEGAEYGLLRSEVTWQVLTTGLFVATPIPALPCCTAFGGVDALWSLGAQAKTSHFRAPANTIGADVWNETLAIQAPALSFNAGIRYALRERDIGNARVHASPFVEGAWQPLLSGANGSSWGALMLRVGVSFAVEPLHVDTLSMQPLIRWLPIVQLAETPLADVIREEQSVTGRIATARENKDAVLEERVVIYRPDASALLHGVPPEALEILRVAVPLLFSRAHCRLVMTVPAAVGTAASGKANTAQAETTLGLLVDYLLRHGVEETSIEAGIGENRFLQGEALQLRIRVSRDVR